MTHLPIAETRRRFADFLAGTNAAAATRSWTAGLFERGLRLADELQPYIGPLVGKRILELGSAYAGDLVGLCARGADCIGSDLFEFDHTRLCRTLELGDRLRFIRCDAMKPLPIADHSVDVVMAMEVLELVEDLDGLFGEIARVLAPGGLALLTTGVTLKSLRRDPIYGLPLVAGLPNRWRRWVAERVFGRGSDFRVSNHNFNSALKFRKYVEPRGYRVVPIKLAASPIMARVASWPAAGLWSTLIRYLAFDFVLIVPTRMPRRVSAGVRQDVCPA